MLTCVQGQKTLSLSHNMHFIYTLFTQGLSNDSFDNSFFQTTPLRDANLHDWSDWSHFHLISPVKPDKACEHYGETNILPLQKRHLVAKKELEFSFRPTQKDQQVGGQYTNVSC